MIYSSLRLTCCYIFSFSTRIGRLFRRLSVLILPSALSLSVPSRSSLAGPLVVLEPDTTMETSSTIIRSYGRLPPELRIAIWTAADADDEVLAIFLSRRGRGGRQVRVVCSHPHRIIGRWSRPQYMLYHHDELCLRGPAPFVSFAADIFNFVEGNLTETLDLGRIAHCISLALPIYLLNSHRLAPPPCLNSPGKVVKAV
ncbi:hypothetical protein GE09DRAFT_1185650 [Coniochaeta sp. 2T2.1]|nr:hypothetical protein GE09DRAFT_1185650 [Coniochaeta sp. 2T2.1]